MVEIYVNEVNESDNLVYGITSQDSLVMRNIEIIFGKTKKDQLLLLSERYPEFHIIDRAYQYVCIIGKNNLGFTMTFYDFKGNIDNALDESTELKSLNWNQEDLNKIIKITNEINNNVEKENAELVVAGIQFE